jgi:hypothetical protein
MKSRTNFPAGNVFAEALDGPGAAVVARFAVSREIQGHDLVGSREGRDLRVPNMTVAAPAVNEHERGRSRADDLVVNFGSVRRRGRSDDRNGGEDERAEDHEGPSFFKS